MASWHKVRRLQIMKSCQWKFYRIKNYKALYPTLGEGIKKFNTRGTYIDLQEMGGKELSDQ